MRPGDLLRNKAAQKARGQDVIAFAVDTALQDVGDLALEIGVVVRIERKIPDALAAGAAGLDQSRGQRLGGW